ncbi:gliding motility-associated ABC transporter permease subunit GldF [Arundinibacter roseus]|uniref:Gliding motility-associated ABC transporter permease subunit GldF n=1 Tax=Arundinibacter roseus TaxID=2070510 RepID=A0A4R4KDA2_9BACT|nr:gliding motility-associated ABC transporter permease subunit GldF [Arundinibacter roseus]TDB65798.1 gliding motility-associated ABC transporter permease subunit GldF [Arundinibacter roseus]
MLAIFQKEISSFFNSLIAYMVLTAFLLAVGLIVWVFPDSNVLDYGYADLGAFFDLTPYVLLFLIPAITMRSIAEENRSGTLELLLTKPLSDASLVLGKFLANWLLVALMLLPTGMYYLSIYQLGNPPGNVDSAAVAGSYVGLLLLGGALTSMGLWASSLNDNQIVAFVIGVFLGFVWYVGFSALSQLLGSGGLALFFSQAALDQQYQALGRGLIDIRNVVYLLSLMGFFLILTYWRVGQLRR